jgi:uncharacterized protein (UPF0248 family)
LKRYHDPAVSYVSATQITTAEVSQHHYLPDDTTIEDIFVDESEESERDLSDSSNEADDDSGGPQEREAPPPDPTWDPETFSFSRSLSKTKHKLAAKRKDATPYIAAPKLRTSVDVYNRLMWDPKAGDKGAFIIGYEDRFKGLQEIGINAWKREIEDKEFVSMFETLSMGDADLSVQIPFHRVVYFKRKSDDTILWDK